LRKNIDFQTFFTHLTHFALNNPSEKLDILKMTFKSEPFFKINASDFSSVFVESGLEELHYYQVISTTGIRCTTTNSWFREILTVTGVY
jgi:hypothetical protein